MLRSFMQKYNVTVLMPFQEWDIKANTLDDAIKWIRENEFPNQIEGVYPQQMIGKPLSRKGYWRVYLLTARCGDIIEAESPLLAFTTGEFEDFMWKRVPYSVMVDDVIIKTDMGGLHGKKKVF